MQNTVCLKIRRYIKNINCEKMRSDKKAVGSYVLWKAVNFYSDKFQS